MAEPRGNEAITADYDLSTPIPPTSTGLRSSLTSYGDQHFSLFLRKAFISAAGYSESALSKPIIGIINTFSSFNPCHGNIPQLLEATKRGILLAGGLPMEFPTISIHESFASPTSMFLRNLMSMDTEEMIKSQPCDAVVMIGGCDKTVPAQLMGGISANKPIFPLVTGPMMPGSHRGTRIGACSDCRSNWARFRADDMNVEEIMDLNAELAPTVGTCGVMGTASTMACIVAGLGLVPLRSGASAPAVSAARMRVGEKTGQAAVAAVMSGRDSASMLPQEILTRESFLNAITVLQAIGGSTNAVVHLMAVINRHPKVAGTISLKDFDEIGKKTPLVVDLKPSGDNYMTDFHNAGGMLALLHTLKPLLRLEVKTYTGETLGEMLERLPFREYEMSKSIIRPIQDPLYPQSSLVVLYGNLCPGGAIMKASASKDRSLLHHSGPACVFENTPDMAKRIDDAELSATKDSVLVLKGIGPVGNPGMPEAGLIPIPRKLARQGVTDMLRISDGRMSGTAGGTIVLHVSPESADLDSVFGIVQNGDIIECDVESRRLNLQLPEADIKARLEARKKAATDDSNTASTEAWLSRRTMRGYRGLYQRNVNQAEQGCDFDFLTAKGPEGRGVD